MPLISAHIEKMYAIHYHLYSGEPFNDHVVSERALVAKTGVQQYVRKVSGSVGMAVSTGVVSGTHSDAYRIDCVIRSDD